MGDDIDKKENVFMQQKQWAKLNKRSFLKLPVKVIGKLQYTSKWKIQQYSEHFAVQYEQIIRVN